jgi:hypothetical protein
MEDGGERMSYDGGALREPSTGKGRYDLISPFALERVACWDPLDDKDHIVADNLEMAFLHINNFKRGNRRTDHIAAATRYILAELNNQYPDFDNKHGLWLGCINPFVLERLAIWYELGCVKYLPRNWESGMSYCRLVDSGMRHLNRFRKGERGEDHLIASVWNWFAYMHYEAVHLDKFDDVPKYPEANSPSKSFSEGGKELPKLLARMELKYRN